MEALRLTTAGIIGLLACYLAFRAITWGQRFNKNAPQLYLLGIIACLVAIWFLIPSPK